MFSATQLVLMVVISLEKYGLCAVMESIILHYDNETYSMTSAGSHNQSF